MDRSNLHSEGKSGTIPRWLNKRRILEKSEENEEGEHQEEDSKEKNKNLKAIFKNLQEIYYNPLDPGSFGGIDRLYQRAKQLEKCRNTDRKNSLTSKEKRRNKLDSSQEPSSGNLEPIKTNETRVPKKLVKRFLADQYSYTLHRPARKHFQRNSTRVSGIDQQWQVDLADMQALSRANHGIKYLMTCIDVFSKYAWVIPVKSKSASEITEAFRNLLEKLAYPRIPKRIQSDKGKEFLNKNVREYLQQNDIEHFTTWSDQKAAVVERFNRTLKNRIWQ